MAENLYSLLTRAYRLRPQAPMFEFDDGRTLALDEVETTSAAQFARLRAEGLGRRDRLVVQLPKSPLVVLLYFACLRGGIVFVPVHETAGAGELLRCAMDCAAKAIVCVPSRALELRAAKGGRDAPRTIEFGDAAAMPPAAGSEAADHTILPAGEHDAAVIIYTSGTTGLPKGVTLSHRAIGAKARMMRDRLGWTPADRIIHALPLSSAHGLFLAMNGILLGGGSILLQPRFSVGAVAAAFATGTAFSGVPTMYSRLLQRADLSGAPWPAMRLFVCSSAHLSPELRDAFRARTGHEIVECYGTTETGTVACVPPGPQAWRSGVGLPLPDVELRLEVGVDRAPPSTGVLKVRGPNMFEGYWEKGGPRPATDPDGYFATGDLARIGDSGCLYIKGREKEIIITGGFNVHPREVERELNRLEGVRDAAVIAAPHPDLGEGVIAVVVADPGVAPECLSADLRPNLSAYKMPLAIFVVDQLPRTDTGKLDMRALKSRYRNTFAAAAE